MATHSWAELQNVARQLSLQLTGPAAIVLIGSVARNCATRRSDVDLLIVGESQPAFKLSLQDFEFHPFNSAKFTTQLKSGDDFPAWCTHFGVPLIGSDYWQTVLHSAQSSDWPDWRRKFRVAMRRALATQLLLKTGDKEAAAESALFAYDHLIRGLLLREKIFPLCRQELVEQIRPTHQDVAKYFSMLLRDSASSLDFRRVLMPLMQTIQELDPETYDQGAQHLQEILLASHLSSVARKLSIGKPRKKRSPKLP